jgi:hypothetical protein
LNKCVSLLDHRCHLYAENMTNALQCVENAECVKSSNEFSDIYGRCECADGFVKESQEICIAGASFTTFSFTYFLAMFLFSISVQLY